jgi:hypothetical protein
MSLVELCVLLIEFFFSFSRFAGTWCHYRKPWNIGRKKYVCNISIPEANSTWLHDRRRRASILKLNFSLLLLICFFCFYSVVGLNSFWQKTPWIGKEWIVLAATNMVSLSRPFCRKLPKDTLIFVEAQHLKDTTTKRFSGVLFIL